MSMIATAATSAAKKKATNTAAKRMNQRQIPGKRKHSPQFQASKTTKNTPATKSGQSPAKKTGRTVSERTSDKASSLLGNRPRYWEPRTVAGYRRMLTAEFLVATGVVLYRAWKQGGNSLTTTGTKSFWRQMGAIWLAFFILALLSSANWKMARLCAMLGGLIMIAMLLKDSQILTNAFSAVQQSPFGTAPQPQEG